MSAGNALGNLVAGGDLPPDERAESRRSFRRPERSTTTALTDPNGLGGRHLGVGLSISAGCIAVYLLGLFVIGIPGHPFPVQSFAAWTVLLLVAVLAHLIARRIPTGMPRWLFVLSLIGSALVVTMDLAGTAGIAQPGYPTAAAAVGALLVSFATLRETRELLAATAGLGLSMGVVALAQNRSDPQTFAPEVLAISLAVIPPVLAIGVVRSFRRLVQRELDLVLVQSTVSQPGFAVGMLASEELARLDLDAETLLDDVAQGRTPLPLAAKTANTAASLATQLRLHLIEGRTETWLHHAITESEFLGPSVTLVDPTGLAGLLSPAQRDALLLTIWLLIGDSGGPTATVALTLGPISANNGGNARRKVRFPIELTTTDVRRRNVDPETWQAIRAVGPHVDSNRDGSLRVDIECSVENPANA